MFDGNAAGNFIVEYLDENGVYQPLINHFTNPFNEWILFERPNVHSRFLRLTKTELNANINEIVIHGTLFEDPFSGDITDFSPSTVNCTDATLSWTIPANSNISQLKLVVTTTNSLVEVLLPPNTSSYTITNLLPETVYEVFLFAENSGTTPTDLNITTCLLYTSPSPRDATLSRMPSSA